MNTLINQDAIVVANLQRYDIYNMISRQVFFFLFFKRFFLFYFNFEIFFLKGQNDVVSAMLMAAPN